MGVVRIWKSEDANREIGGPRWQLLQTRFTRDGWQAAYGDRVKADTKKYHIQLYIVSQLQEMR